jgi:hypothetical protein
LSFLVSLVFANQDDYEADNVEEEPATVDENRVDILEDVINGAEAGDVQESRERVTTPYMTKYERARVLGTRALQIRYALFGYTIPDLAFDA